jgi:hypothetical protein
MVGAMAVNITHLSVGSMAETVITQSISISRLKTDSGLEMIVAMAVNTTHLNLGSTEETVTSLTFIFQIVQLNSHDGLEMIGDNTAECGFDGGSILIVQLEYRCILSSTAIIVIILRSIALLFEPLATYTSLDDELSCLVC